MTPARAPIPAPPPDATRSSRARAVPPLTKLATGALVGAALWAGLVLLGVTQAAGVRIGVDGVTLSALLGALAVWAGTGRRSGAPLARAAWVVLAAEAAMVLVAAYTPLSAVLLPGIVRRDPAPREPLDGVVVLSTWVTPDGDLRPDAVDRLLGALELVRATGTRTLLLSRTGRVVAGREVHSDADQARLVALLGERAPRVLLVTDVHATRDEAVKMWALARRSGIRRVAVVTSPSHSRRACAAYERVGFVVACVPSRARDLPSAHLHNSTYRLEGFRQWLYETAAWALYRARGWV